LRAFYCFLIIMVTAILWLLPVTDAIYNFRTDVKTDTYYVTTGAGVTATNSTLTKALYLDDVSTIDLFSDLNTDLPIVNSYNTTTRALWISGLTASDDRTLTVSYDYDALNASAAISNFLDKLSWIWLICIAVFPVAAIVALFIVKRN
jgi:hypothetical protein